MTSMSSTLVNSLPALPTTPAAPTLPLPILADRVHHLASEWLDDRDRIIVHPGDRVGGGTPCVVASCPRPAPARTTQVAPQQTLCSCHRQRWADAGRPDLSGWDGGAGPVEAEYLKLDRLPTPLRWEIAYGIGQARDDNTAPPVLICKLHNLIGDLARSGISSLLDHEETQWPAQAHSRRSRRTDGMTTRLLVPFFVYCIDQLERLAGRDGPEHEIGRDIWRLRRLGFPGRSGGLILDLTVINQPWLREATKQFLRWRINTGHSSSGIHRDYRVLARMADVFTEAAGAHATIEQFDRTVITATLTRMVTDGHSANGRSERLSTLRTFLALTRQHDWIPGLPTNAALYAEDFPKRTALLPKALPDTVMAQLEHPDNLARLTDPRWRLLFPLLMETGLRINDALHLPAADCLTYDQQNAPYLRYRNRKMKRDALVPISMEMAAAITTQATLVRAECTSDKTLLFHGATPDCATKPASIYAVNNALRRWLADCNVVDDTGQPAKVTLHQFRHTLGTRLINNDVPQEVVRKILDHSSSEMTAHYARLHDDTVRRHWERARKVDIHGDTVTGPDDAQLADAAWTKRHLAHATQALPNGYCGLPLQQSCPHANACLTCPVFITTAEFLPQHKEQLAITQGIIERAEQRGQLRLIEMNNQTASNLTKIINSLETDSTPTESNDQT